MPQYLVYTWPNLSKMTVSKMRKIAEVWQVPGYKTMTRSELRTVILDHPRNRSPVPHPLIKVPVE